MFDGVKEGEVLSEKGKKGVLHQRDEGFACIASRGPPRRPFGGQRGATLPIKGPKTVKFAGPPHDSGYAHCSAAAPGGHSLEDLLFDSDEEDTKSTVR